MYNGKLPSDMHYVIFKNLTFDEKNKIKFLNKDFYELWHRDVRNSKIINKFFKKYCKIHNDYLNNPNSLSNKYTNYNPNINYNDWNTKKVYRYYIQKYPMKYLQKYPEFITNKSIEDIDKKNECHNWINNNLNKDTNKRTRRDIYNFFIHNKILIKEIFYTGW